MALAYQGHCVRSASHHTGLLAGLPKPDSVAVAVEQTSMYHLAYPAQLELVAGIRAIDTLSAGCCCLHSE